MFLFYYLIYNFEFATKLKHSVFTLLCPLAHSHRLPLCLVSLPAPVLSLTLTIYFYNSLTMVKCHIYMNLKSFIPFNPHSLAGYLYWPLFWRKWLVAKHFEPTVGCQVVMYLRRRLLQYGARLALLPDVKPPPPLFSLFPGFCYRDLPARKKGCV